MSTLEIIFIITYFIIGLGVLFHWWDNYSENDKEMAENGTTGFIMVCILLFWPLKLIYNFLKNQWCVSSDG